MAARVRPDSNKAIGDRLRFIRVAYGRLQGFVEKEISQAEFGRRVGVERQSWHNSESGYSRIGLDSAMMVVRKVGVTLDYIYFGNQSSGLAHALAVEIEKIEKEEQDETKSRVTKRA